MSLCRCFWCSDEAHVEGYCRACFLYCLEFEPELGHELLMRTQRSLASMCNWSIHKQRERRGDAILKASEEADEEFACLCAGFREAQR